MPFFLFALGAVLASFVSVVVERINTGQAWISGRSACNSCAVPLVPLDLIPVVSWLMASGRCRHCGSRVPALYAVSELWLGVLFALSSLVIKPPLALAAFLVILVVLAFVVLYDLRHTIVPPPASALLLALSLAYAFLAAPSFHELGAALMVAGVIGLAFLALHAFSRGRLMGLGDAPIALSLSLIAAPYAFSGLLYSFWIGAIIGILILVMRRGGPRMGIEVPFVPFLAAGYLLACLTPWHPFPF